MSSPPQTAGAGRMTGEAPKAPMLSNWNKSYFFTPAKYVEPTSIGEIQAVRAGARNASVFRKLMAAEWAPAIVSIGLALVQAQVQQWPLAHERCGLCAGSLTVESSRTACMQVVTCSGLL